MDRGIIFSILQIEETKDKDIIKSAYRKILVTVNPEENPEGFKRLREAYEEALIIANEKDQEESEEQKDETPIGQWIEKVSLTYASISKRLSEEEWDILLKDTVCYDLDTSQEAKIALFSFLADNYRLPNYIWKKIDRQFFVKENKEEFYEKLPRDFVDFIIYQCEGDGTFPYEYFKGEDKADYDTFIYHYFELAKSNNDENVQESETIINTLKTLNIEHPYLEVEISMYLKLKNNIEQSNEKSREILKEYSGDLQILSRCAWILWENGCIEEAVENYKILVEQNPKHYYANKNLAHYYLEKEEYEKAKEHCTEAIRLSMQEQELVDDLHKINEFLLRDIEEENKDILNIDIDNYLEFGWSYLQNEQYKKGLEFLLKRRPSKETEEEYIGEYENLLSRFYYSNAQYKEAIDHAKEGIRFLEESTNLSEEELEKKSQRIANNCEIIAKANRILGSEAKQDKEVYYEIAIEYIEKAIQSEKDNILHLLEKAKIQMEQEKYYEVIDTSEKILEMDEGYFWAYVIKQEAFFELKEGQGVIDNFYDAKKIYAYYPKMYEIAMETFINCNQIEDAEDIYKQAEEMKVVTNKLKLLLICVKRIIFDKEDKEAGDKLIDMATELKETLENESAQKEEIADVYNEMTRICRKMDDEREALKHINEAIKLSDDKKYIWAKACILLTLEKYKPALDLYKICLEKWPESDAVYENIGYCYKNLDKSEEAMEAYKKALYFNPDNLFANEEVLELYIEKINEEGKRSDYDEAIPYGNKIIELSPESSYDNFKRGRFHMSANEWDKAEADYKKAIELDSDGGWGYNNLGCVYEYTRRYEEAIAMYLEAIRHFGEGKKTTSYNNIASTYERMGELEKAIECYQKCIEMFPESARFYKQDIKRIFIKTKRYDEAMRILLEAYSEDMDSILEGKGWIHLYKGHAVKGIITAIKMLVKKKNMGAYDLLGDIYMYLKMNTNRALKMYAKAIKYTSKESDEYINLCLAAMECCCILSKKEELNKYFEQLKKYYEDNYGGIDKYVDNLYNGPERASEVGTMYYFIGDIENAEKYFNQITELPGCRRCLLQKCPDYFYTQGLLAEAKGDIEKAISYFKECLKYRPSSQDSIFHIKMLEKKK